MKYIIACLAAFAIFMMFFNDPKLEDVDVTIVAASCTYTEGENNRPDIGIPTASGKRHFVKSDVPVTGYWWCHVDYEYYGKKQFAVVASKQKVEVGDTLTQRLVKE